MYALNFTVHVCTDPDYAPIHQGSSTQLLISISPQKFETHVAFCFVILVATRKKTYPHIDTYAMWILRRYSQKSVWKHKTSTLRAFTPTRTHRKAKRWDEISTLRSTQDRFENPPELLLLFKTDLIRPAGCGIIGLLSWPPAAAGGARLTLPAGGAWYEAVIPLVEFCCCIWCEWLSTRKIRAAWNNGIGSIDGFASGLRRGWICTQANALLNDAHLVEGVMLG